MASNIRLSGRYSPVEGSSSAVEDDESAQAHAFAERLAASLGRTTQAVAAKRSRVSTSGMTKYLSGSEPGLFKASRLAKVLNVSLQWLATGEGRPSAAAAGFVSVPIYDVRLAAGTAGFADAAEKIGEMPFDPELLRQLGRTTAEGLAIVEAMGDSMEPTIPDGARVLLDTTDTRFRDGVYGFRFDDELRVKRLRRSTEGIEVLSDNPRYPPERISGADLERFGLIGRVHWIGAVL